MNRDNSDFNDYRLTEEEMKSVEENSKKHDWGYTEGERLKLFEAASDAYHNFFYHALSGLKEVVAVPNSIDTCGKIHRYIVELLTDVNYHDSACLINGCRFGYAIKHYEDLN